MWLVWACLPEPHACCRCWTSRCAATWASVYKKPASFFSSCPLPSQGLARHDAVDPIAAARRERHQHHNGWLCGAGRVHQRRHQPQLSPGWWWRRRHLRRCGVGGASGEQSPPDEGQCFSVCSHSSVFSVYFRRKTAMLLSFYLGPWWLEWTNG